MKPRNIRNRPRNATGWWASATTAARKARWMPTTASGARGSADRSAGGAGRTCPRSARVASVALMHTAIAAFQPKVASMKAESHCQVAATISTGGAANEVSVPPIEMLTNSTPNARYLGLSGTSGRNTCGPSSSAASVIAAGSVMAEPNSGTAANPSQAVASGAGHGRRRAITPMPAATVCRMGRDAATTITTNTNSGSVNWRDSR